MGADRPVLVLQHIACEPAAAYGDELLARGIPIETARPDRGEPLPDWRAFCAIVAMGGPMAAYEEAVYPWLSAELALIGDAVRGGVPYWGVCLGAQLLAAALGAPVRPGEAPEIGVLPVALSEAAPSDPVFAQSPREFAALQWHGDTYELPRGATHLASSALCEQQAFVFRRAYGLQFHLEASAALVADWGAVPAYRESLQQARGAGALSELLAEATAAERRMNELAREIFGRWLEDVVRV
jgi:GMP synthase-like glutamine amidotransferase